ncbi:MAG: APC family permease [Actinomycetota bacterium]
MSSLPRTSAVRGSLKRLLVGRAISTDKAEHQLLPKFLALPVFSSDPLSSVAYATEEMMLVLVLAGAAALRFKLPIAIGIATLLLIVITSYRQTVKAYPRGGGSYIVARENLGIVPGLFAAAAILIDYVLTVAVSITAGTVAITSALPALAEHRVALATGLVLLVTLANLRGVREAGMLFALPTYGFVAMVTITLFVGFVRCLGGCPLAATASVELEATAAVTLFLLARAFASGATALTGVEAIADGVQAFRHPQSRNAASTLAIMGAMAIAMFLGITVLAHMLHVRVNEEIAASTSVLAQIGRTVFGGGLGFALLQIFTAAILVLAANTAFQDFPRLSSILARDRFMPSQFRNRGDRLVYSNGVIVLAAFAVLLIYVYDAQLTRLIQLYVVGVFTAFTLSQSGMVRRWIRLKATEPRWARSATINGVGAVTTGLVLVVVTITKWKGGAWIVVVAMPLIVLLFRGIHRHYVAIGRLLHGGQITGRTLAENRFVLLVHDLGAPTLDAIGYLRALRPEYLQAVYTGPESRFAETASTWLAVAPRFGELLPLEQSHHGLAANVRALVRGVADRPDTFVTVVIPERLAERSASEFLRHRETLRLKLSLLFEPGVVVTDIPLVPGEESEADRRRPVEPARNVVIVPVPGVNDAVVRAVIYAAALRPSSAEAMFLLTDPEEGPAAISGWHERQMQIPLVLVEAPFRDLGAPLLEEIRRQTSRGDTVVTVVIPEVIPGHWWESLLHNQTGLYFKRLLLFEPGVVVTSVPYHAGASVSSPAP